MNLQVVPINAVPRKCPLCDLLQTNIAVDDLLLRKRIISASQVILWAIDNNDNDCIKTQVRAIIQALPKG
jgi:hypothetical protein